MPTKTSRGRCPACGRREKRSSVANARYWKLLTEASEKLRPQYGVKAYHVYYATKFIGANDLLLPNGKIHIEPESTSDLDTDEFSAYMTAVEADLGERGVFLPE